MEDTAALEALKGEGNYDVGSPWGATGEQGGEMMINEVQRKAQLHNAALKMHTRSGRGVSQMSRLTALTGGAYAAWIIIAMSIH